MKATNLHLQIEDKETEKSKFDQKTGKHQEIITKAEKSTSSLKERTSKNKDKLNNINKEIEQKGEKEQVKVHREIEDLKVSIAESRARTSTLKDEINKIKQRKDQFKEELNELGQKSTSFSKKQKGLEKTIARKQRELKEIEEKIENYKKKHKIESSQELDQEIEKLDSFIEKKQEEVQTIRQTQQELLREKDRAEYQLQTIDERIVKVKEVEQENKDQIKKLQN